MVVLIIVTAAVVVSIDSDAVVPMLNLAALELAMAVPEEDVAGLLLVNSTAEDANVVVIIMFDVAAGVIVVLLVVVVLVADIKMLLIDFTIVEDINNAL